MNTNKPGDMTDSMSRWDEEEVELEQLAEAMTTARRRGRRILPVWASIVFLTAAAAVLATCLRSWGMVFLAGTVLASAAVITSQHRSPSRHVPGSRREH